MANNPHLAMATLSSPSASGSATVAGELSDVSSPPGHSGRLSEEEDGSSSQASGSGGGRPDPVRRPLHVTPEELRAKFQDFDDRAVYERVVGHALGEHALNFVVEFGNNTARVACDLTEADFELLLAEPEHARDPDTPIRWINIWNPSEQRGVIEAVGRRYHFSRRLTMSIWAWDVVKKVLLHKQQLAQREELLNHRHIYHPRDHAPPPPPPPLPRGDLENGMAAAAADGADGGVGKRPGQPAAGGRLNDISAPENLATFKMMQDNLNYTSIDQEQPFVCLGANWLHRRPPYKTKRAPSLVPPKHWSWFALCDDHTVLSFHEAAYYDKIPLSEDATAWKKAELRNMRSNTLKVFRQLSKWGLEEDQHKFTQLTSVRQPGRGGAAGGAGGVGGAAHGLEGSSNLFYYLFEDYSAAFDILNSSKTALEDISGRILRTADWKNKEDTSNIIPMLYKLNKELRQLHHLFSNYKTLIDRLLSSDAAVFDDEREVGAAPVPEGEKKPPVLSTRAVNRFKRLQVQMQSLMLDAIKDCLDEKTSLQDTYFSLITQKDSHSTERLTRSATLLAKLSVFFLPISFMTSYFSVQIPHLTDGYTAWTYWGAFAVIASISFLSLFFFSKVLMFLSERLDHWADRATRWTSDRAGWRQRQKSMRALEAEEDL